MIQRLKRHKHMINQLMRFSVVGGSSSVVHFTCVLLLVHFVQYHPLHANIIAFLVGFLVSFFGHRYWTFKGTTRSFLQSLPRFLLIASISFALNETFYWYLLTYVHMYYLEALVIVLAAVSVVTFTLSKLWAFHIKEGAA
jgi:putative flippase GtrA